MDISPRNTFNCRLASRYWQVPTDLPKATHYNVPVGTHFCDQLGFLCHPQEYQTFHRQGEFNGCYRDIDQESQLKNLDYYNPEDSILCPSGAPGKDLFMRMDPSLVQAHYAQNRICVATPRVFRNTSKLYKYNQS